MAKENNTLNAIFWIAGIIIFLLVLTQLPLAPLFTIIAPDEEVKESEEKLYEYYDEGEMGEISFYYGAKVGNVFEVGAVGPDENFNITSLEVQLRREGSPGTIYAEVRKSGTKGKPYGEVLSSGSINGNHLDEIDFEWKKIDMTPYTLNVGERYVFFLSITGGDEDNMAWVRVFNDNLYPGGNAIVKVEEGWRFYDFFDVLFKIRGIGPV